MLFLALESWRKDNSLGSSYSSIFGKMDDVEIALGDMLAKAEVVALAAVSLNDDNQITQTLPIGQLSEHHHQQLIPASEVFHIAVAIV